MNYKKGNILVIVLVLSLLTSLGLAGYFFLKIQKLESESGVDQNKTEVRVTPTPIPVVKDEMRDWKTYTDQKYNFSVKYPPNWNVRSVDDPAEKRYTVVFTREKFVDGLTGIQVKENWTVKQEIDSHNFDSAQGSSRVTNLRETTVGSYSAKRFSFQSGDGTEPEAVVWSKGSIVYSSISFPNDQVFDQILSTFKFSTPNQVSNTNWKTYTNRNGVQFSIQYPEKVNKSEYAGLWEYYSPNNNSVFFGPPSSKSGGYLWSISAVSVLDKTIDSLVDETGKQFKDRVVKRESVSIGIYEATVAVVTTPEAPTWYSKTVYIPHQGLIFVISNGAVRLDEFDTFYKSFKIAPYRG